MNFRFRMLRFFHLAMLIGALLADASDVRADFSDVGTDGWYTWRIDAVEGAPDWCCWSNLKDRYYGGGCNLDSRQNNFGSFDEGGERPGEMHIYVQLRDGALRDIRTLSEFCPVRSETPVRDIGKMPGDDSIAWLRARIGSHGRAGSHVLAAIAVHAGDEARDTLLGIAARHADIEQREDAVFWLGQVRGRDAEAGITELMFTDPNPGFREHAAFALAESNAPGRVEALAKLGREDDDPDVRAEAWFWLAQTGAPEAAKNIRQAVRTDSDRDVREDAVFALSQLPGEEAVEALVSVVEDRDLHEEVRKEALFWLAQLESESALNYIDRLFGGN